MRSKRIESLENYIYENKTVTIDHLCEVYNVSKNTIRRDIDELVANGRIKKIYGGVTVEDYKPITSFEERNIKNLNLKKEIAMKAAELVMDGEIIFIDSGTTTMHMIDYLKDKNDITILTNSVEVIVRAIPRQNITVISLSGILNRKTLSFTGSTAADVLSQYNISKSFLASTGISAANGATNSSPAETEIKKMAVTKSSNCYVLVDHTKFNVISLMTFSTLDKIDAIITDDMPEGSLKEALIAADCNIILTGEEA